MRKILLLLILILPSFIFSMGWSDWSLYSPGNTRLDNYSDQGVVLNKNERITENVVCWYFYKNSIIGKYNPEYITNDYKYFIFNENNNKLEKFNSYKGWQYSIKKQNLKPLLFTRWYTEDWKFFSPILLFLLIIWFPISLPITIFYLHILIKLIKNESSKQTRNIMLFIWLATIFIILFRWFLDEFPSSI